MVKKITTITISTELKRELDFIKWQKDFKTSEELIGYLVKLAKEEER